MIANATPSIVQTPAASPSTPSEKLTTFIIPTSQIDGQYAAGVGELQRPRNGIVTPVDHRPRLDRDHRGGDLPEKLDRPAAARMSSIAPTSVIRHAPAITPHI